MYYYVNGRVDCIDKDTAVIDCGGVGYACRASMNTLANIKVGETHKLFTYLYIREDAQELFGFCTQEELSCFKQLIAISGVGPKAAMAILSVLTPGKLALAVMTNDEKPLTAAAGVGKKLAQRVVLELKGKMSQSQFQSAADASASPAVPLGNTAEVMEALESLGYSYNEAADAIKGINAEEMSVGEAVRAALKNLSGK